MAATPKPLKSCTPISVSKVRVIVRVRPFLAHETSSRNGDPISCSSVLDQDFESPQDEVAVYLKDPLTSRNECYQLDSFFGQEDNNVGQIFCREVSPFVPGIFSGCNATVFAYGATGSGKTYTMQGTDEQPGLMPLAMSMILSTCQSTGRTAHISYYKVYMDRFIKSRITLDALKAKIQRRISLPQPHSVDQLYFRYPQVVGEGMLHFRAVKLTDDEDVHDFTDPEYRHALDHVDVEYSTDSLFEGMTFNTKEEVQHVLNAYHIKKEVNVLDRVRIHVIKEQLLGKELFIDQ
ncbi:kinesin-like protein KIN-10B [Cajanus cajan]|uniref:kinesin-like protein KIN-10B n=1 Tax=Cajanus cajan TaxID=3821 RepID=UPI0010FB5FCB|nr:kinesin-like protein KIN-10B [Cajanus cajan]